MVTSLSSPDNGQAVTYEIHEGRLVAQGHAIARLSWRISSMLAGMSDDASRFRKQAEEARQHAERAISPLDKETWLRVAGEWIKLAETAEDKKVGRPLIERGVHLSSSGCTHLISHSSVR